MNAYPYDYTVAAPPNDPYSASFAASFAANAYGPPTRDEVRTIFITGFPCDIKERELNNLMRFLPGYVACQMNRKNGQAQGFALFENANAARAAAELVSSIQFDDESVLRCEMAHKNMFLKDDPITKRNRFAASFGSPTTFSPFGAPAIAPIAPQGFAPVTNTKDNATCNTLFIGNLGDNVSDADLKGIFGSQPGFKQLKIVRGPKNTTCFVEYGCTKTAMTVHDGLQGAILPSSDRGGIRIQYSKNPFGKRRESSPLTV
jgi:hypothetical protein